MSTTSWTRFSFILVLAIPLFFGGFGVSVPQSIGLTGVSDQAVYLALLANFFLFVAVGKENYVKLLVASVLCSLSILITGPIIRFFYQSPETYSAYYLSKFLNMMTVIPAALALILSFPIDELEKKLFEPHRGKQTWRKITIICMRVIRYMIFHVMPVLQERILEERTPHQCLRQIRRRDRLSGRTIWTSLWNIGAFLSTFCGEILFYALGAALRNVDLWARWISEVNVRSERA